MSKDVERKIPNKTKPTFRYAIISVTLILFLVGSLFTLFFGVNKILAEIKESIEIEVELNQGISSNGIDSVRQELNSKFFINTIQFYSKEEAIKSFEKELNQNIIDIAGFNPLYDAYLITLKNEYSVQDSLKNIQQELQQISGVKSVNYSNIVIDLVNANMKKVSTIGLIAIGILLLIAYSLIDSTIRLMMFSQRFIIRSMQLIGATKSFIIKPFILKGLYAGIISGILAVLLIFGGVYLIQEKFHLFQLENSDYVYLSIASIILIAIGIAICLLSTILSVNKYLRTKLDELY
ncbi:MAG: permease-like cell division protein FtsX [Chitinophagales bacterium]|nr:permease-like cell division protein FtsX [Chitinophagales bacterium]MCZ2394465.1 permease-like cell division protein FtsX [Chitinophagales bacterium]